VGRYREKNSQYRMTDVGVWRLLLQPSKAMGYGVWQILQFLIKIARF